MQKKVSILGKEVYIDETTKDVSIEHILRERLRVGDLEHCSLDDLHDPFEMLDMEKATQRIIKARENHERVMVFGDYDVDGVTSTSLMMHLLKKIGIQASYRVPHRIHDGYGLKKYFIDEMVSLGVALCITVDCGSRDAEVVSYAKEKGLDIIITDHHQVPEKIPEDACAFLNPHRPGCPYPFKHLAGAGVALKVIQALTQRLFSPEEARKYLQESVDISAIGTVADCMLLQGENRTIVIEGLKQIKYSRSQGIRRLIEEKIHEDLDADIFGFLIGPRLNAAGRLDTPYKAVNLILNNEKTVYDTLTEIEELNTLRKEKTKTYIQEALENISTKDNIIIYVSKDIHHGIIGIVAGRLCEQFYRPAIVLVEEDNKYIASCRSPEYISIIDILEKHKDLFLAFGGHEGAAGFSISKENFPVFQDQIIKDINALDFTNYAPKIEVTKVLELEEVGFRLIEEMQKFKPFGRGYTKPIFYIEDVSPKSIEFLGKGRDHIKFTHPLGYKIFAFGFGQQYEKLQNHYKLGNTFSCVVDISEDNFMGRRGILIKVIDIVLEK